MLLLFIQQHKFLSVAISSIVLLETTVIVIGSINLIGLHIFLKYQGLTTFEYIMKKKKNQRKISQERDQNNSKICSKPPECEVTKNFYGNITVDGQKSND